nr:F390 synthetase-related protein [Paenibacillus sp. OSY-SE]
MDKGAMTAAWEYIRTKYGRRWSSREALERWQHRNVVKQLRRIVPHSPFFRERLGELPLEQWRDMPIMNKSTMMEHFDTLNTVGIRKEDAFAVALAAEESRNFTPEWNGITVGMSSGTSGNRGLFLVSAQERMAWSGAMLAKALPGSVLARERIALFLRADSNLYGSVSKRRLQFAFFDLLAPFGEHVKRLNAYAPTLLVAPPSMLRMLADALAQGQIAIHPRKLFAAAEVLDPLDEAIISAAFKQPVHQIYQCTEGFLGITCEHGTLHLNEDLVCIEKEWLNKHSRKFTPVITDFRRLTQPMIRYRLDDVLTERNEPCPCGSPFTALECIEGRHDDMFYMPSLLDGTLTMVFPDFIRRAIMSASSKIEHYAAVQHAPQHITVALQVPVEHRAECERNIAQELSKLCEIVHCAAPDITFTDWKQPPAGHKLRRIERKFRP